MIGDGQGKRLLTIEDFRLKRLGGDLPELFQQRARDLRYDLTWVPVEPCAPATGSGTVLIIGAGTAVRNELSRQGVNTVLAPALPADGWELLLKTVDAEHGDLRTVLYLHPWELIQALAGLPAAPRLWFVTRGAQALPAGTGADPLHSALWGLGRVVRYEIPALRQVSH